ncbi:GerAB/ArcD/ProY family transporter [Neobacillus drentensis]|uniref:GerAB/ArcD/ProY family transporter n=1 Tax=Neobacillus drentensis TaxID=220684 RepID=UPI002860C70D|nr:endospore germination permease [Neobacillus drentensis]MDR7239247.1 spore germination protein (amino acid permease) [Neobacillus drentensis]
MIKHSQNQITFMQYIFLIHGVQVGVGVLTLPRELAEIAGTDGWIAIIIGWLFSTLASLIIVQVMKKYPNGTIIDLLTHYFGKWVGKIAALIFVLYFAFLGSIIFFREGLFIQFWVLPQTDVYILLLLLSIPSYLIVRNNITILGRYAELVFFMTTWMIFFYFPPLKEGHWLHLLPIIKEGWKPILTAAKTTIFSFIGFEITFFLYPFLQKKQKASSGIVIANTLTLVLFLIITISAFAFYSPDEITLYNEPTITMLKIVEFKFLERLEIVFFSLYIFVISTSVLPFLFVTVFSASQLFGKQDHSKYVVWLLILILGYVFFFPPSFDSNNQLQKVSEPISLILVYAFPFCLWVYLWLYCRFKRRVLK